MKNIPVKYHPAVRKLIKKAREDEQKKILDELLNEFEKAKKIEITSSGNPPTGT